MFAILIHNVCLLDINVVLGFTGQMLTHKNQMRIAQCGIRH